MRKGVAQKTNTTTGPIAATDIHVGLSFLEQQNVSLKHMLIAKLRAENENLFAMLERAEQRPTK